MTTFGKLPFRVVETPTFVATRPARAQLEPNEQKKSSKTHHVLSLSGGSEPGVDETGSDGDCPAPYFSKTTIFQTILKHFQKKRIKNTMFFILLELEGDRQSLFSLASGFWPRSLASGLQAPASGFWPLALNLWPLASFLRPLASAGFCA